MSVSFPNPVIKCHPVSSILDRNLALVIVEVGARKGKWTPIERKVIVEVIGKGEQEFTDDGSERRLVYQ
ncbi:MAG: hypothetical protein WBA41_17925 [Rivularia sp. (in: cyanobacteria)]